MQNHLEIHNKNGVDFYSHLSRLFFSAWKKPAQHSTASCKMKVVDSPCTDLVNDSEPLSIRAKQGFNLGEMQVV